MGIHYDYKSTRSAKLMEKQAKREKKLAEKKAKRLAKEGAKSDQSNKESLDASQPLRSNLRKRKIFQKKNKKNDIKR